MSVKFIQEIIKELNITPYRLGKLLGVSQQAVRKWAGITKSTTPQTGLSLPVLCKIRKLSGKTWNELGKALDSEFLDK